MVVAHLCRSIEFTSTVTSILNLFTFSLSTTVPDFAEAPAGDHQVADGERQLGVGGVDGPNGGDSVVHRYSSGTTPIESLFETNRHRSSLNHSYIESAYLYFTNKKTWCGHRELSVTQAACDEAPLHPHPTPGSLDLAPAHRPFERRRPGASGPRR